MNENFRKLKDLLTELFQLDAADLDFGIYRIMNQKRDDIVQFLEHDLLPQVRETLQTSHDTDVGAVSAELRKLEETLTSAGVDPSTSSKVQELRAQMALSDITGLESEVFSHLTNFFRRYYSEGDFISLRRYKPGVYAIPYEGEEVKLHWANADQYYIKTSEYFRDYTFTLPSGKRAHFRLAGADTERDNNLSQNGNERRFILCAESPLLEENGELMIRFEYRQDDAKRKQAELSTAAVQTIMTTTGFTEWQRELASLSPTENNPRRTLLEKHLTGYTARNTFDYLIHKDLNGFLRRELDFFIKNEVVRLDDIEDESAPRVEQYLAKVKALRHIGHKIIAFLAQIEEFQKKLWLKKKFVLETNYCVTLDRVPEELYPEIITNTEQIAEWKRLFSLKEIPSSLDNPGYSDPLTIDFLMANSYLMIDTRLFSKMFVDRLLTGLEDIDEQIDGTLMHSENFQALELLKGRFEGKVKSIYIDPPYNTEQDRATGKFLYKDGYERSSWLSLLNTRLSQLRYMLCEDGVFFASIDEHEVSRLMELVVATFRDVIGLFTWVKKKKGSHLSHTVRDMTEYVICAAICKDRIELYGEAAYSDKAQPLAKRTNTRKELIFPCGVVRTTLPDGTFEAGTYGQGSSALLFSEAFSVSEGLVLSDIRVTGPFVWTQQKLNQELNSGSVAWLSKRFGFNVMRHGQDDRVKRPSTLLDKVSEIGTNEDASKELLDLFAVEGIASYPKPVSLVAYLIRASTAEDNCAIILDSFAGSGTTAHAVINLNREDDGNRKYILIEMGEYFDTVLKPRIMKVIYSKDWKDGKPVSREGVSHMLKYIRLESYEDTLNNLALSRSSEQGQLLDMHPQVREEYMLQYVLDVESRGSSSLLNVKAFEDPFNYTLNISTGSVGEMKPATVDLVETFNYLLGLRVKHVDTIRGFRVVQGTNPRGEKVLVIWRNVKEQSSADLDEFFLKQGYNTLDMEFDLIYVNGDNNLENLRHDDETWKVRLIDEEFQRLMFDVEDV